MKVNVKQNTKDFRSAISKLNMIADGSIFGQIVNEMSNEALKLSVQNAEQHKNVQGRPWKPLKKGGSLSFLASTIVAVKQKLEFLIIANSPIALIHVKGAKKRGSQWTLPARSFAPKSGQIAKSWNSVLEIGKSIIDKLLGGS